jgi:uncharacterized spore protein YtfJ
MASLSSPIGPTIDVVARTVSRSVISGGAGGGGGIPGGDGGGGGGRGGALAVQPQASLVNVERNLEVQTVQNVQQTQEISALRGTVDALRTETATLNNGLGTVSNLIQQDSALEKQQAAAEAESERKLLERNIRLGKESQLEQNITNALAKPVQALQKKVGNIFGRIGEALTILFAGWLTNQGIEALKAESEGNKNKLEEIKDNVLKHIGYAIGAFAAIKIGFNLIIKTITGLTGKIGGLVLKLATAPLNLIRKGLQAVPFIGPRFSDPKPGGPKPGPKPGGAAGILRGARNFVRGLGLPLLAGTALTGLDIAQGEDPGRAIAGAAGGMAASTGAFALGSLIPIPLTGVAAGALAYGPGENFGKGMYDKFFGKSETPQAKVSPTTPKAGDSKPEPETPPPTIMAPAEADAKISSQPSVEPQNSILPTPAAQTPAASPEPAAIQPQTPAIPPPSPEMTKQFQMAWDYRNNGLARGRIESAWNNMTVEQQQQAKIWAKSKGYDWTEMKLTEKPSAVQAVPLPSAQVQPLPKPTQNVGELAEPAPNVVIMPSGQGNNQQSSISPAPTNGTDTPLISSSNPDNFYVLYSQLNYNVVI